MVLTILPDERNLRFFSAENQNLFYFQRKNFIVRAFGLWRVFFSAKSVPRKDNCTSPMPLWQLYVIAEFVETIFSFKDYAYVCRWFALLKDYTTSSFNSKLSESNTMTFWQLGINITPRKWQSDVNYEKFNRSLSHLT